MSGWLRHWIKARPAQKVADPDGVACYESWENARKRCGEAPSLSDWRVIWSGACYVCDLSPARGVDHVLPVSKGGRNVVSNLLPCCVRCNRIKNATVLRDPDAIVAGYWSAGAS